MVVLDVAVVVVEVAVVVAVAVAVAGRRWNRWMFDFRSVWNKI